MDETGSWEIAKDEHDAFEALDQNSGGLARRLDPMIAGPEGGPSSDMQRYEG
jgi:hypothetical protein